LYANAYNMSELSDFVKSRRKQLGLNQVELAEKAGVALTVIRKIEQDKDNLSLAKVNHVLHLFGHVLGPINENDATRNS
jgi:y4mF family transcriptional regulator